MRYTEVRMAKLAHELLADLERNRRLGAQPRWHRADPAVMPIRFNLLVNGFQRYRRGYGDQHPAAQPPGEVIDSCWR